MVFRTTRGAVGVVVTIPLADQIRAAYLENLASSNATRDQERMAQGLRLLHDLRVQTPTPQCQCGPPKGSSEQMMVANNCHCICIISNANFLLDAHGGINCIAERNVSYDDTRQVRVRYFIRRLPGSENVMSWTLGDLQVVAIVFQNRGPPDATMILRSLTGTIGMLREASSRRHFALSQRALVVWF